MQVQQVADNLGVTPDTVRYYTRVGLLHPLKNTFNGYHEYDQYDRHRLRFILSARHLGFSVADIQQILEHADKGESPCHLVRELIESRLEEVNRRFDDMARLKRRMEAAVEAWKDEPDHAPTGEMICYLIENFSEDS